MRRSPGLKAGCLFNGACLASFCSSKVNPTPPDRRCGALQETMLTTTSISCFQTTSGGIYCCHGGYANQKSKHAVLALGNRVYMGALENTHPQTNGFGKYVLFPVLRYIYSVSIDILKGNSFYIGV